MSRFCSFCGSNSQIGPDGVACATPGCPSACHPECAEASCRVNGWIFRRWVCPECLAKDLDKQTSASHVEPRHACKHKNKPNHSCDCLQSSSGVLYRPRNRHSIGDPNFARFGAKSASFVVTQRSQSLVDCDSSSCYCLCSCKIAQSDDVVSKTVSSNLSDDVKLVSNRRNESDLGANFEVKSDEMGYEEFREGLSIFQKVLGKIKNSIRCTSTPSRVQYDNCVWLVHFEGDSVDPAGVSGYDERREPILACGEPIAAQRLSRYSVEHPQPVHFGVLSVSEGLPSETKELAGDYREAAVKRTSGVYRAELVRLVDEVSKRYPTRMTPPGSPTRHDG